MAIAGVLLTCLHITGGKKVSLPTLLVTFLAVWFFTPVLGQTMLWLIGSTAYLWSLNVILLFLLPFRMYAENQDYIKDRLIYAPPLFILGVAAGWLSPNGSGAACLLACMFLAYYKFNKIRIPKMLVISLLGAIVGFIIMLKAPGNFVRAGAYTFSLNLFVSNVLVVIARWQQHLLLLTFCVGILFWKTIRNTTHKKTATLSIASLYVLASYAGHLVMVASPQFPSRATILSVFLLLISVGILLQKTIFPGFFLKSFFYWGIAASAIFFFIQIATLITNFKIIDSLQKEREKIVFACKARGQMDITVPTWDFSDYSVYWSFFRLADLSTGTNCWKNQGFAKYYGVNTVDGVRKPEGGQLGNFK